MTEITIWIALGAGLLSFFSPCIFPLVPAYLAQVTGTTISNNEVNSQQRIIMFRSVGFILGFTLVFMLLGASSTYLGQLFNQYSNMISQLGGIIIILFGLQMTGLVNFKTLMTGKSIKKKPKKVNSFGGSVAFGVFFAAGWTPCVGIVLGSILALASQNETVSSGILLLLMYSIGLGVPFLLVGFFYSKSIHKLSAMNRYLPVIQKVGGYIMIAMGLLLFTGYFQIISSYLAQFVPFNI